MRGILLLAPVVLALIAPAVTGAQSAGKTYDPVTMDQVVRDTLNPPSKEELSFTSGSARLNGFMYVAQGVGPHPTVILLHGYPGIERNLDLAQAIRRAGMNVLFFDYRGSWGSGGTFSFSNAQEDVASAIRYVRSPEAVRKLRVDPSRVALIGHSMGGWLAFLGAAVDPSIACVGGIEAADMTHIGGLLKPSLHADSAFVLYANQLTAPGAPLRASSDSLIASLKANAVEWTLPHHAAELSQRTMLLLDNAHNALHESFVTALRQAGARHLTEDVWKTDHSFSDRRIELAHAVIGWLHSACGY